MYKYNEKYDEYIIYLIKSLFFFIFLIFNIRLIIS